MTKSKMVWKPYSWYTTGFLELGPAVDMVSSEVANVQDYGYWDYIEGIETLHNVECLYAPEPEAEDA